MHENPDRTWQFGVAELLATMTAIGLGLGLFQMVRRAQPSVDPVSLVVLLASLCGLTLGAFLLRKKSGWLRTFSVLVASLAALGLLRFCVTQF